MAHGHVKWFSSEKGYGFITRDGEEDVFVHHSQINMDGFRTLDAGEPVEFEIMTGDRGPKARNVLRVDADSGREAPRRSRANGHRAASASRSTSTAGLIGQIRERLFGRLTKHA